MTSEAHPLETLITLDQVSEARPILAQAQLYPAEVAAAMGFIQEALDRILAEERPASRKSASMEPFWSERRSHLNIGILGCRGAGKTSVLLTLMRLLGQEVPSSEDGFRSQYAKLVKGTDKKWDQLAANVDVIGMIEPSHMEKGDHIVAAVFATMLFRAREHIRHNPPLQEPDGGKAEALLKAAQQVTEHLPALLVRDRLADAFKKEGSETLYEEVVRSRSGYSLERAFWAFIEAYLDLIGRKLAVLCFDDVDLAWERGYQVLESLRRYLTSPQMVVLVTGDPALFAANLARTAQWTYGVDGEVRTRPAAAYPDPREEERQRELVTQYLKKVLPPSLRVPLLDLGARDLEQLRIRRNKQQEPGQRFRDHFVKLLGRCLGLGPAADERLPNDRADLLFRTHRFLVPRDVRQFLELCRLDPDVDADKLLYGFARVWQQELEAHDLQLRQIPEWVQERHLGLRVLSHILSHGWDDVVLRLDPRTHDQGQNVVVAFLRFIMEAHLRARMLPGSLSLALEFFVPAHYLGHLGAGQDRGEAIRELDLQLMDSPRRLYRRLVPWLARQRQGVLPGVVQLCRLPGQLETMLDLHDGSLAASWRGILGDPERRDFVRARREASERCADYLGLSLRRKAARVQMSGARWATELLPRLLKGADRAFEPENPLPGDPPSPADRRRVVRGDRSRLPLLPELAPSPALFDALAGALSRVVLRCWMVQDGERSYLSVWQGLSLVHRVLDHLGILFKPGEAPPLPSKILATVKESLLAQLGVREGPSPGFRLSASGGGDAAGRLDQAGGLPEDWRRLAGELREADAPLGLFPGDGQHYHPAGDATEALYAWPVPPVPWVKADLERRTLVPRGGADAPWKPLGTWSGAPEPPWEKLEAIESQLGLGTCTQRAWEGMVDRLAMAITEWVAIWWTRLFPAAGPADGPKVSSASDPRPQGAAGESLGHTVATFFEEVGDELSYAGDWSGAGDVIQRWVLSFLNSVLVHNLIPPRAGTMPAPVLVRGVPQSLPPRSASPCCHALYENLMRLKPQKEDDSSDRWRWDWPFLALASFPTLALFLPSGDPLPKATNEVTAGTEVKDLGWIVELGKLLLLPLPPLQAHRQQILDDVWRGASPTPSTDPAEATTDAVLQKVWRDWRDAKKPRVLFDLAGLSWCGLDLVDEHNEPLADVEPRRSALIEMLNAVQIEAPVVEESRPYRVDLRLAVVRALRDGWPPKAAAVANPSPSPRPLAVPAAPPPAGPAA